MAPETPRGVSSRLLTMKFMQRAAASASSSQSPHSQAPSKKRKLEHTSAQGRINTSIDQALIKAALDDQEAARQAALEKRSFADTHWVLDDMLNKKASGKTKNLPRNIVYVGYGNIDWSNESGAYEEAPGKGRTSTKVEETPGYQNPDQKHGSADDGSDDQHLDKGHETNRKRNSPHTSEGADSSSKQNRLISQLQSRQSMEGTSTSEFRDKTKKREGRLTKPTSISSGGRSTFVSRGSSNGKTLTCYNCHQVDHRASDCPQRSSGGSLRR